MKIKICKDCIEIIDGGDIVWIPEGKMTELIRAMVEYKREQKRKRKHPKKYQRRQMWGVL